MSYPIPPEGHAVVIVHVQGRLQAYDILPDQLEWSRKSAYYMLNDQSLDWITVNGRILHAAFYDPTTGQTEPEPDPAGLPPARKQLEAP
jgi:hypothetical protein